MSYGTAQLQGNRRARFRRGQDAPRARFARALRFVRALDASP